VWLHRGGGVKKIHSWNEQQHGDCDKRVVQEEKKRKKYEVIFNINLTCIGVINVNNSNLKRKCVLYNVSIFNKNKIQTIKIDKKKKKRKKKKKKKKKKRTFELKKFYEEKRVRSKFSNGGGRR